jgi:hypothetical protein
MSDLLQKIKLQACPSSSTDDSKSSGESKPPSREVARAGIEKSLDLAEWAWITEVFRVLSYCIAIQTNMTRIFHQLPHLICLAFFAHLADMQPMICRFFAFACHIRHRNLRNSVDSKTDYSNDRLAEARCGNKKRG